MDKIDIKQQYGDSISQIRSHIPESEILKEILDRGFNVPDYVQQKRLLFVGLNPSYSLKEDSKFGNVEFYKQASEKHELGEKFYEPYYNPLLEIAGKVKMAWTHWDLFYMQETKQDLVKQFHQDFTNEQINLSIKIIKAASPKIVVVNNALASRLIKDVTNPKMIFDDEIGTYRFLVKDDSVKGVPIFFCSMLSGQRAMDTGSKERLIWHIKYVIKKDGIVLL